MESVATNTPTNENAKEKFLLRQTAQNTADIAAIASKSLFYTRLNTMFTGLILAAVVLVGVVFGPRAYTAIEEISAASHQTAQVLAALDADALGQMIQNVSDLAVQGAKSLEGMQKAAEQFEKIDIEKLNKAVDDLQKAVAPLARLFG